ncbi:isopropylmalate isomerase [Haloarcula hispanica N601]|uniref:3-isopropylmalate dehydratase large subunit n=3 Tax=Haloarcula hispanica TaxID=51589 RepID=V5TLD2_HALHI|nr:MULTISPECIES: 3-isopropylmalate dehydratase large subunit [Haloarcula]AEM56690.1 3-isopropylmalate dehydratase large subunit / isopropylmalate isomerase large subunit [Haloarcula hispanica ATCC 33960]AHB65490.1 isopropylmalate isomerase [Haloarcula hispanica N601]AJF26615.1 isopropylmalate isomerase [Haloarcula sp. CBA1115]KAA9407562.1 3-isopropylmalate dehydratase large subunit [Haloarcula sp. CBA1131]KAA9409399.1 3-isopropylmalate dehydratase large subunit [Haloarcula hispanica]
MSQGTLYDKVWDQHKVTTLPNGQDQLFVGLHLIHEVTSPQAFGMLKERGLEVARPDLTHATVDHIVPTANQDRPYSDDAAETMMAELEENVRDAGIQFSDPTTGDQGIVHVIGPEQGITQPGKTIVCGDSHTSTHGAFGALAFGIGTSQIRDVLATQTIAMEKQKVRKIEVTGELDEGVEAKDIILEIIRRLGTEGGVGYVYEYAGETIENLDMEGRMSICNMSIEGGARAGYVNPDETTYEWLEGTDYFQEHPEKFEELKPYWESIRSDDDAEYDDVVEIDASELDPVVTWGTTPGQGIGIDDPIPEPESLADDKVDTARRAQEHMRVEPGETMEGYDIDVAFLGSCTNARLPDLRRAARIVKGREVADDVRAFVVPGSQRVQRAAEEEGLKDIFEEAGFEWRNAGCSMCLGMNEDQLEGDEACASSSNRNFVGRQGSKDGRTVLMNPRMVAAAAITGEVSDVRDLEEVALA